MKKFLTIMAIVLMTACSTKLMLPGQGEELVQAKAARSGQKVFMESCHRCHPSGNAGLGPSLINKPLPGFLIKMQVRNGYGVMPSFDKEHLSDEELNNIVKYIKEL